MRAARPSVDGAYRICAGNIINAVWAGAKHAGRLLNGLGMNGSAAVGFAAGISNHLVGNVRLFSFLSLAALELP